MAVEVAAAVVVIQAALPKKAVQSMVVITIQVRTTRAIRVIILITVSAKARKEVTAKVDHQLSINSV